MYHDNFHQCSKYRTIRFAIPNEKTIHRYISHSVSQNPCTLRYDTKTPFTDMYLTSQTSVVVPPIFLFTSAASYSFFQ